LANNASPENTIAAHAKPQRRKANIPNPSALFCFTNKKETMKAARPDLLLPDLYRS
jgi:hypothetical protein